MVGLLNVNPVTTPTLATIPTNQVGLLPVFNTTRTYAFHTFRFDEWFEPAVLPLDTLNTKVTQINCSAGIQAPYQPLSAPTQANIVLNNNNREVSSDALYASLTVGTVVWIFYVYNGTKRLIWCGKINYKQILDGSEDIARLITINCEDFLTLLENTTHPKLVQQAYLKEFLEANISLDEIGFPYNNFPATITDSISNTATSYITSNSLNYRDELRQSALNFNDGSHFFPFIGDINIDRELQSLPQVVDVLQPYLAGDRGLAFYHNPYIPVTDGDSDLDRADVAFGQYCYLQRQAYLLTMTHIINADDIASLELTYSDGLDYANRIIVRYSPKESSGASKVIVYVREQISIPPQETVTVEGRYRDFNNENTTIAAFEVEYDFDVALFREGGEDASTSITVSEVEFNANSFSMDITNNRQETDENPQVFIHDFTLRGRTITQYQVHLVDIAMNADNYVNRTRSVSLPNLPNLAAAENVAHQYLNDFFPPKTRLQTLSMRVNGTDETATLVNNLKPFDSLDLNIYTGTLPYDLDTRYTVSLITYQIDYTTGMFNVVLSLKPYVALGFWQLGISELGIQTYIS